MTELVIASLIGFFIGVVFREFVDGLGQHYRDREDDNRD